MTEAKNLKIQPILAKAYEMEGVVGAIDRPKFESFIKSIVNGDSLLDFVVMPATFGEKDEDCLIVFILTDGKLARIRIVKNEFTSSSAYLNQIIGVNKIVSDENRATVVVEFPQGRIGLNYQTDSLEIDRFFQKVDAAVRGQRAAK